MPANPPTETDIEALEGLAPFSFGNTLEGRMVLDKAGDYFCYVHVEQRGGGSVGFAVEGMRRKQADKLLAGLNALPTLLATIREKEAQLTRCREALEAMVEEKVDYMRRNLLGDPEAQHTIKQARAALDARDVAADLATGEVK